MCPHDHPLHLHLDCTIMSDYALTRYVWHRMALGEWGRHFALGELVLLDIPRVYLLASI